jgi:hypothetical protein
LSYCRQLIDVSALGTAFSQPRKVASGRIFFCFCFECVFEDMFVVLTKVGTVFQKKRTL